MHARGLLQNMHHINTHSCEIEGDEAHADSYVIGLFLNPDASIIQSDYLLDMGFLKELRSADDVSYQRPLNLEETPEGHRW